MRYFRNYKDYSKEPKMKRKRRKYRGKDQQMKDLDFQNERMKIKKDVIRGFLKLAGILQFVLMIQPHACSACTHG